MSCSASAKRGLVLFKTRHHPGGMRITAPSPLMTQSGVPTTAAVPSRGALCTGRSPSARSSGRPPHPSSPRVHRRVHSQRGWRQPQTGSGVLMGREPEPLRQPREASGPGCPAHPPEGTRDVFGRPGSVQSALGCPLGAHDQGCDHEKLL